jgi:hypothetical protein
LGVGIEIDYQNSSNPNLDRLQEFVDAYRSQHPYDATGNNPAARPTVDVGLRFAGDAGDAGHAGLPVLGSGVSVSAQELHRHRAAELL